MSQTSVALWDRPTRILHWIVAMAVVLNLFLLEDGEDPHKWTGYVATGAVALRLFWGFFSAPASRLRALRISPRSIYRYVRSGLNEGEEYRFRHNPVASLVYLSLWALIFALGVTGWMMGLDAYWGEEWLEELHSNLSLAVKVLVIAHLFGLAADSLRYRRHTWRAMITGRRE